MKEHSGDKHSMSMSKYVPSSWCTVHKSVLYGKGVCIVASLKPHQTPPSPRPLPLHLIVLTFSALGGLFEDAKAGGVLFNHVSGSVWGE